jgi:hypothetical protein
MIHRYTLAKIKGILDFSQKHHLALYLWDICGKNNKSRPERQLSH